MSELRQDLTSHDWIIIAKERARMPHELKKTRAFKNHGPGAGTSLEHPHSQIVATPVVPPYIRRKYEVATQHFDDTGGCLHHDMQRAELEDGERIVARTDHFVVLHPFASHYPFEAWIMPRLARVAGFELGSGIYINIAIPEESAAFMRDFRVKRDRGRR